MLKKLALGLAVALIVSAPASALDWSGDGKHHDHDHDHDHDRDHDRGDHRDDYPNFDDFFRLDCRYHNVEHNRGAKFCYASAVYRIGRQEVENVHLGVGCDNQTIFNDRGRVQVETTLDRFSPFRAATPGVEVFPQGQLNIEGTYTSVLDISLGRFSGLCYIHKMKGERHGHDRDLE